MADVTVVIPSSLRRHPDGSDWWWQRAAQSAFRQSLAPAEVLLAVDPGVAPQEDLGDARLVRGDQPGHQAACNAGVREARAPLVAFLEDDDEWEPWHLGQSLAVLEGEVADLVTNSQRLVDPRGNPTRLFGGEMFHFPTPSGWVVRREFWLRLGGFDPRYKIHHDNEFLGRCNRAGGRRAHVWDDALNAGHPWLQTLGRFSPIIPSWKWCAESHWIPSVRRTVHPNQIMADPGERSAREYADLEREFGVIPW